MLGLLKRLFDANDKEVKKVMKTVEKINKLEAHISPLSDEELKAKTTAFRERLTKGETLAGRTVAIVEDVTTTGESALKAAQAAQESGARVAFVLTIVDRQEGATETFAKAGLRFHALFTADEFLNK